MKAGASMYNERGPETRKPSGAAYFTPGLTSRLVVTGLLCWALAGTAYAVLRLTFGDRPVSIHVRWAPTIDDAVRFQMEQRYQLAQAEPREDRTFGYALTDRSRDNIRNLVLDPAVEDTHAIHRTAFRVGYFAPRLPYVTPSPGIPAGLGSPIDPWFPWRAREHQSCPTRAGGTNAGAKVRTRRDRRDGRPADVPGGAHRVVRARRAFRAAHRRFSHA